MFARFAQRWLPPLIAVLTINGLRADPSPPVRFIENKLQWPEAIDYMARVPGGRMAVNATSFKYFFLDYSRLEELHLRSHGNSDEGPLPDDTVDGHAVFVNFLGANPQVVPQAFGRSSAYFNYYIGNDRHRWASEAHAYDGMLYEGVYPGIDLKIYGSGENVKYDWIVAPGADPSRIRVSAEGADKMFLKNGSLFMTTSLADIIERKPYAYQIIGGRKVAVKCRLQLEANVTSFVFPEGFDPCYELVIDPLLIFSTYSGSTADNWGSTATPGEHGKLYSAGVTNEENGGRFPATAGAYQTTSRGLYDIGILKYDSLGGTLLFATYLGGDNSESPHSLVMNASDELVLLGTTSSANFPATANAYSTSFSGGAPEYHVVGYNRGSDIVISRFNGTGTALLASTYIGGSANDGLNPTGGDLTRNYGDQLRGDVITDAEGNIYVSSVTSSRNFFRDSIGLQPTYQGGETDAILFRMNAELTQMPWGTYLGGGGADAAHTLKFDSQMNILIAGGTTSNNFPVTAGSYQSAYNGGADGWIARVAAGGGAIMQATYTGTPNYDQVYFLDVNAQGDVYVYGQTSGDFLVTPGVYSNPGSGQFVQKFDSALTVPVFSTVFGAGRHQPDISPTAFLVNDCNNLYMAGWGGLVNSETGFWDTGTTRMVTTPDAFQSTTSGSDFYFMVLTEDASELLYATFVGGTLSRTHVDGGTSRFDKNGIVYHSVCAGCAAFNASSNPTSDFPTTSGAWSRTNNSFNCNNAAFKFDLSSLKARIRTNSEKRDMPGLSVVCIPNAIIFENHSIGGEIFEWDLGDGTTLSKTDSTFVIHQYEHAGKYLVKLRAIDQGTCTGVDEASVVVTANVAQSYLQDDADICFGTPYKLQAGGAAAYSWSSDDGTFASQEATPTVNPPDTTTYFLTLTEANGCVRKDTVRINVVPGIDPDFEWRKESDCLARPDIRVRNLTDSLQSADLLFFDFGDGITTDHVEEEHSYEDDGVYAIRLVARRQFCVWEKTVSVPVFEMLIPNVITPGTPGDNDVFTIRYGRTEGVTPGDYGFKVAVKIYNRWGGLVYESNDYRYDWSGQGLEAGIYYYEVSVAGHATCKSWLQLIK